MTPSQIAHVPPEEIVGREADEWIGATPDSPVPDRVKLRVFRRWNGRCHISGRKIRAGEPWDAEHVKPIWAGGENRESNLKPALVDKHRVKTAEEAPVRAKADRRATKHLGLKRSKRPFPKRKDAWGWRP